MSMAENIRLIEQAQNLQRSIDEHFSDLADIAFLIQQLEYKQKRFNYRIERDCDTLKNLVNSDKFKSVASDKFVNEMNELIDGVANYIKSL